MKKLTNTMAHRGLAAVTPVILLSAIGYAIARKEENKGIVIGAFALIGLLVAPSAIVLMVDMPKETKK